ncbi:MAG: spore coat protein [Clostridia bacterium]|nr:spore coat protein [Clostridia bacterium]
MEGYKRDVTLNEKDSLQDLLNTEKTLVKIYGTALTEGASDGFRKMCKTHFDDTAEDQLQVFLQMTNHGYYKVESAPQKDLEQEKTKFCKVKSQLS